MNDLTAISNRWLSLCPSCDASLPRSCVCCTDDPRQVIFELWKEVTELRGVCRDVRRAAERSDSFEQTTKDILRIVKPKHCGIDGVS